MYCLRGRRWPQDPLHELPQRSLQTIKMSTMTVKGRYSKPQYFLTKLRVQRRQIPLLRHSSSRSLNVLLLGQLLYHFLDMGGSRSLAVHGQPYSIKLKGKRQNFFKGKPGQRDNKSTCSRSNCRYWRHRHGVIPLYLFLRNM